MPCCAGGTPATPGSLEALGVIRQAVGEIELMLAMLAEQRDPGEPNALIETLDSLYPASFNLAHDDTAEAHQPEETAALSSEPETIGTEQFDAHVRRQLCRSCSTTAG